LTLPRRSPAVLADWGELRFLEWVRRAFKADRGPGLALGIGDDAAHLRLAPSGDLIVTTDALIEGVHFRRDWISPRDLGAKALISNLSDLAAMAARPQAAFLALGVPPQAPIDELKAFFLGLRAAARRWSCPLVGGDLVRAPQWTINLTLLGSPAVARRVAMRSAARPGWTLCVTGFPGESAAGMDALRNGKNPKKLIARHRRPTPRLPEAGVLARACRDLALIDISDGVASEAAHIARASDVRVDIELPALPVSPALLGYAAARGVDPTDWILFGGEDYELLFATDTPVDRIRAAFRRAGIATPLTPIGRIAAGRGLRLLDADGRAIPPTGRRFEHFA
jgi:thiamine-monophosphate kinase